MTRGKLKIRHVQAQSHTQLPWQRNGSEIYGHNGRTYVAEVFDENESARANAHLIAAAPELLRSLKQIIPYAEAEADSRESLDVHDEANEIYRLCDEARRIVKMAEVCICPCGKDYMKAGQPLCEPCIADLPF